MAARITCSAVLGKAKMPVEMAGMAIEARPSSAATRRSRNGPRPALCLRRPRPILADGVDYVAAGQAAGVGVCRGGRGYRAVLAHQASLSAWICGPPRREIIAATLHRAAVEDLAALTIASTASRVKSPWTSCKRWPENSFFQYNIQIPSALHCSTGDYTGIFLFDQG
jgi:hypothetical protein